MKIVITGASDGIGAATARRLVAQGASVVVVGRSEQKTREVARELKMPSYVADFGDLKTVYRLASQIRNEHGDLNVLINNAGAVFDHRSVSQDWHEMTFQVNYLAPFLLTKQLLTTLQDNNASVLNTSSAEHRTQGKLNLDDLENARDYAAMKAYSSAKLANVLFTRELHHRYHAEGISTAAFHPGRVMPGRGGLFRSKANRRMESVPPEEGSRTIARLAMGMPGRDWISGGYYEGFDVGDVNPQVHDGELSQQLWQRTWSMITRPIV
jgi:NAD(P)-dependent dehydrogenase (short-subunit alcohol dehydrogenase family)